MRSESTWTPPREDCDTSLWHAPDGMATEWEVSDLIAILCRALRPKYVLETGTYLAHTARKIARILKEHEGFLFTVEKDPTNHRLAQRALMGLPAEAVLADSLEWESPVTFDFMFYDSEIEVREQEMRKYRMCASRRCVWALHDTRNPRLSAALARLSAEGLIGSVLELDTPRGMTLGRFV